MKTWIAYLIALAVVLLDQVTKNAVVARFEYGEILEILPVFDLTLRYNTGAAFSFLADAGGWQRWFFTAIAVVVSALLAVWIARTKPHEKWLCLGLALVLGGAIGNLYDRIVLGHVVDFIAVHWNHTYFPAFNVADSAITVGAGVLMLEAFFVKPPKESA